MNIRSRSMLAIITGSLLVFGTSSLAVADCAEKEKEMHKLKFKVKDDQCVVKVLHDSDDEADADTIHVCEGDTVSWKVSGPKKSIVFAKKSPFDWADSGYKGNKIEDVVRTGASKDCQADECKYTVMVEGLSCVFDPKIIVDP